MIARRMTVCAWVGAALLLGCDSGPPTGELKVYPVEGQVLFQGKPLAGAQVSFHPVDEKQFGGPVVRPTGQTDGEGRYHLMTYISGDGAPAGPYQVSIAGLSRSSSAEANVLGGPNATIVKTDVTKGRYLDPKASKLTADVKAEPNVIPPFDLK